MPAPTVVRDLVERFETNRDAYHAGSYNETQLRREFLDPLFRALGWDIDNTAGYAEAYKDVIHEDAIRIGAFVKAPDYCFRIGGARKFFLEAKKPAVDIRGGTSPAFQLRRYAWSAKLPLSILSDFEEFAVYDCRVRPAKDDPASTARVFFCTCDEFEDQWDWIASVFSREAVLKGSFDKYAEGNRTKRGTAEVDDDFLATIEAWRADLARNLALRNPQLSQRELNFAVQRIIDRIIFLRICEDRGIENYGRLQALTGGDRIYPRLCELFYHADQRYNSGLFHFRTDPSRSEPPDELTASLGVDDKLLRDLLGGLYYPESPYEFSVFSADILGQVYEQFLGKVIRLTEGHQAKVEEKPEVRKAGGVYYTPTYIVDYIVRNTVGALVDGKTPKQAEPLRVLDMACGSGSFLIGAYQYLLDWHLVWYTANDPERWARGRKPALVQTRGGWRLTIDERKRILLSNLYGVDIDAQAVEVTKLSLLLKVLEGETQQTLQPSFALFHERALPDLGCNIKCGNSLIGSDFYQQPGLPLMDMEETLRINAFDWDGPRGFPEIMKAGGFDAVIGNPPYLGGREWTGELWRQRPYYLRAYECMTDQYDLYGLFVQKTVGITRTGGRLGLITPNTWFNNDHYLRLREWVLARTEVRVIGDFRDVRVFRHATVLPVVVVGVRTDRPDAGLLCEVQQFSSPSNSRVFASSAAIWKAFAGCVFNLSISANDIPVLRRMEVNGVPLGELAEVRFGVKVYQRGKGVPPQSGGEAADRAFEAETRLSDEHLPYVWGEHVLPWRVQSQRAWLRYGPHLAEPRNVQLFMGPRVLVRRILGSRLILCPVVDTMVADQLVHTVKPAGPRADFRFLAAVLASRPLAYYLRKRFNRTEKVFPEVRVAELRSLPVPCETGTGAGGDQPQQQVAALADRMLALHAQLGAAKLPQEREALQRQIEVTDQQIDRLVYELYGLTDEEIRIVEEATCRREQT